MRRFLLFMIACLPLMSLDAQAQEFCGVSLPNGLVSFADSVVAYDPTAGGGASPSLANAEPSNALGAPDSNGGVVPCTQSSCTGNPFDCPFVSLGDGGNIIVEFTNNRLTGSGSADADLWIFEVGPQVEDTFVEISTDGVVWQSVGMVGGSIAGVDIDAFGFGPNDEFSFVRLTDDTNEGGQSGVSVGADIDAVAAISTVAVPAFTNIGGAALVVALVAVVAAHTRFLERASPVPIGVARRGSRPARGPRGGCRRTADSARRAA